MQSLPHPYACSGTEAQGSHGPFVASFCCSTLCFYSGAGQISPGNGAGRELRKEAGVGSPGSPGHAGVAFPGPRVPIPSCWTQVSPAAVQHRRNEERMPPCGRLGPSPCIWVATNEFPFPHHRHVTLGQARDGGHGHEEGSGLLLQRGRYEKGPVAEPAAVQGGGEAGGSPVLAAPSVGTWLSRHGERGERPRWRKWRPHTAHGGSPGGSAALLVFCGGGQGCGCCLTCCPGPAPRGERADPGTCRAPGRAGAGRSLAGQGRAPAARGCGAAGTARTCRA